MEILAESTARRGASAARDALSATVELFKAVRLDASADVTPTVALSAPSMALMFDWSESAFAASVTRDEFTCRRAHK